MKPLRYLDICSGYSACTIGWQGLPFECVGYAEIDPAPAAVLSHRYGAGRPRAMPDPAAVIFPPGLDPLDKALFEAAKGRKKHDTATPEDLAFIDAWKDRAQRAANIRALNFISWGDSIPNFGDFTTIGEQDVGPIDLLIGGTPCQAFSIAGRRLGLDAPRGNLTLEFLALAKRLRPRWVVWENVPGILSHDEGRTLGTFLWILGQLGYGWSYRVLDSQFVRVDGHERAVPQRRKRVFVVGYLGAGAASRAVLFDPSSLRGDPAPRREAGQDIAGTLRGRAGGGGWPDGCDAANGHLVAHTLRGEGHDAMDDGTGKGTPLVTVPAVMPTLEGAAGRSRGAGTPLGMMVPAVAATLDAAGGDSGGGGTRPQMLVPAVAPTLRAGGNQTGGDRPPGTDVDTADSLVPVMVSGCGGSNGAGIGEPGDPAFTLDAQGAQGVAVPVHCPEICPQSVSSKWAKGSSGPAGDEIANLVAFTVKDHGQDASAEVSPTLRSMEHAGSHANGGGQVAIAFPANMSSTQCASGEREVSPALQAKNPTAIAFDTTQITNPHNRSNPQPDAPCHALAQTGHPPSLAMIGHNSGGGAYRVRRLTPRECERLQAAPDDFTLVPYLRGKPMADGPRYKMIGNSQSANKLRWIGRGIVEVEAELRKAGMVE